ncbi:MAG TPA: YdeI/OmpD-associated family protein [Anaerolineales bacterium]|nr:YdeI/OmpD-associated family protein [Anaerolineales bacterium]
MENAGLNVNYKKTSDFSVPKEFQDRPDENLALQEAFYGLTPGRQRQYLFYFSQAKLSKTRQARVEKHIDRFGLND